jgi:hypothetical protein
MKFLIYRQAKSAMQSGKKNSKKWLVAAVEEAKTRKLDELMGWVSNKNTFSQLKFQFQSKEEAVAFAKKNNFEFDLIESKPVFVRPKSYAENFTS